MTLDQIEQSQLRAFLINVYGAAGNNWPMTDSIFNLTYRMLDESRQCSDLMDLVPRPHAAGQAPIKWLSKQVRGALLRNLKDRKQHYAICVKTAAWKLRPDFDMAANGL